MKKCYEKRNTNKAKLTYLSLLIVMGDATTSQSKIDLQNK